MSPNVILTIFMHLPDFWVLHKSKYYVIPDPLYFKIEIVAMPPPSIDICTHTRSRVKMKIVAMPPPRIYMSTCFKVEISMDMSTHTQFKMEIVAPPPNIDISTCSRFKMEIVAVPPPSIDRSTHTRLTVETVPPSSIPLLFHPGLQVELQNSLNYL